VIHAKKRMKFGKLRHSDKDIFVRNWLALSGKIRLRIFPPRGSLNAVLSNLEIPVFLSGPEAYDPAPGSGGFSA